MNFSIRVPGIFAASLLFVVLQPQVLCGQESATAKTTTPVIAADPQAAGQIVSSPSQVVPSLPVPRLIKFSGVAKDASGQLLNGVVGITFSIYATQEGGTPLWTETQNLDLDAHGHYTVLLGASQSAGLPLDLFATGEPRWLGAKVELPSEVEQPRVLLVSVPYALKASDADTLGGMPASAFMMAPNGDTAGGATAGALAGVKSQEGKSHPKGEFSSSGTQGYIPVFIDNSGDIGNSIITQSSSDNIGIGVTNPTNAKVVIGASSGGSALNASNLVDTDFFVNLTAPHAATPVSTFGPSVGSNLALQVGSQPRLWISNSGNVGIADNDPVNARLVAACPSTSPCPVNAAGLLNAFNGSNDVDTDFFVSLTQPGASTPYSQFGPNTKTNLALSVGGFPYFWITNAGNVGVDTTTPNTGYSLDVEQGAKIGGILVDNSANDYGSGDGIDAFGFYHGGYFYGGEEGVYAYGGPYGGYFYGGEEGVYGDSAYEGGGFYGAQQGVYAETNNNANFAAGVFGYEYGNSAETFGLYGYSASDIGIGTYGQAVKASASGTTYSGLYPFGVWGDSGADRAFGVYASADDGWGLISINNSNTFSTVVAENLGTGPTGLVIQAVGNNGACNTDVNGNLSCTGVVNAVAPVEGGAKKVALSGIQSPENWFEDAGSAQLSGGEAVVSIESVFGETVNTGVNYHVFLTPNGDCKGLYVARKSATSFVVRELGGGTSSIAFDYRIMAKRKGFEEVRLADKTAIFSLENSPQGRRTGLASNHMPTAQEVRAREQAHVHKPHHVPNPKPGSAAQARPVPITNKR